MKNTLRLFLINLLFTFNLNAQIFEWIKPYNTDNVASLDLLKIDAEGNVYRGGKTNDGVYISKYAEDGTEIWVKLIESYVAMMGLALDTENNIVITGRFATTVDFDPGPGSFELVSTGVSDIFILKLNSAGDFLWAKQFDSHETSWNIGRDVTTDADNNIIAIGAFRGEIDFDPGPDTYYLGDPEPWVDDYFILKLDASGNFIWAKDIQTLGLLDCHDVETDESGNVYTAGFTKEIVDFNPGPDEFELGNAGEFTVGFILKLNGEGDFVWAKGNEGPSDVRLYSLRIFDESIYSCGTYHGLTDLDPNDDEYLIGEPGGGTDGLIQKWTLDGEFVWGAGLNSDYLARVYDIDVDLEGNVYTTGSFRNKLDLDPGESVVSVSGDISGQIFISKLSAEGEFIWGQAYGADEGDGGYEIRVDALQNIFAYGAYRGEYDFDLSEGEAILISDEIICTYLMKLSDCDFFYKTDTIVSCDPYTWVNGETYSETVIAGYVKANETGCDSILKLVYINHSKENITEIHSCEPYTWLEDGITYDEDVTVSVLFTGIEGCDSVETLVLIFDHVNTYPFVDTCSAYTWIDGVTYTNDTLVSYLETTEAGCDSLITLCLFVSPLTSTETVEICAYDTYTWADGLAYNTDTTVTQTFITDEGCDSISTLNLSLVHIITTVSTTPLTLKADMYGDGETHQWLDCDNDYEPIPGETEFYFYPTINGNYAVEITKDGCIDTSACYAITLLGLPEQESNAVLISPNPSSGQFNLQFEQVNNGQLTVRNLNGQTVYQKQIEGQSAFNLQLNEPAGIYILELKTGEESQYFKLVKL